MMTVSSSLVVLALVLLARTAAAFVPVAQRTTTTTRTLNTNAWWVQSPIAAACTANTVALKSSSSNNDVDNPMRALDEALANRLRDLEQEEARLSAALEQAASRLAGKEPVRGIGGGGAMAAAGGADRNSNGMRLSSTEIFDQSASPRTIVQGGSLRTFWFSNPSIRFVQLLLKTQGRPLDADVNLWQGPDNTPHKLKVYVEDGGMRTFHTLIATPIGPNTVAVRNTGMLEFPLDAVIEADRTDTAAMLLRQASDNPELIQGGALRTWPFDVTVDSVTVMVTTDGRPLNARIELLQGPNNNKQVVEVYTEDGMHRPFFAILETPGSGNVVRIVNTAPVEFPMVASVKPYIVNNAYNSGSAAGNAGNAAWTTMDGIQIDKGW